MEFNLGRISRPREVMEIFKNVNSHREWKYTIKMAFWPNIKCDILGNILMHMWQTLGMHKVGYFYHGKAMEFKGPEGAQLILF